MKKILAVAIPIALAVFLIFDSAAFAQDSHKGIAAPLDNNADTATLPSPASGFLSISNDTLDGPSTIMATGILLLIAIGLIALALTRPKE